MPEKVKVNRELNIIEVILFGDVTVEDSISSLSSVEKLSKETGITNILVNSTKETSLPSIAKIYNFSSNLPRSIRFAVIAEEDQSTIHDLHFLETVAKNRGFLVQIFTSKNEALKWFKD